MSYYDLNDYEILSYISENNEEASEIMFKKYEPFIITTAKKMYAHVGNIGMEMNDLIQEGRLGLSQAINVFDESKETVFYTLAKKCIEAKMINYIIACKRKKHQILNDSLPFEYGDEEDFGFERIIGDYENTPENIILNRETTNQIIKALRENLSFFEQQVFELKLGGFTYKEIAQFLEKKPKDIDNTLHRIKKKLKELVNK